MIKVIKNANALNISY